MDTPILLSAQDTFLVAISFAFILFLCVFRLDAVLARPSRMNSRRQARFGTDENGEPVLRDPDGRLVEFRRIRRS
jgi:hypothetical protein